jgi:hypothetical protein
VAKSCLKALGVSISGEEAKSERYYLNELGRRDEWNEYKR